VIVESKFPPNHVLQLKVDFIAYSLPSKLTSNFQSCPGPEEWVENSPSYEREGAREGLSLKVSLITGVTV